MWGSVGVGEVSVGEVRKGVGSVGKVWRDLSGECGERCWVRVWEEVSGEYGRCGKRCRRVCGLPPHFSRHSHTLFPHVSTTSTLTPYTLPHLPILLTSPTSPPYPNTLPHSSPTFSHSFHITPYLTQLLKLPKIPQCPHHPYSSKFSILPHSPPNSFPYSPTLALSIIPFQNFSLCSFIAKFSQAIKYTKNFL